MLVYNKEDNSYSRYIPKAEYEILIELEKRIKYTDVSATPQIEGKEELIIDDAQSLEQFLSANPQYTLEMPINARRMSLFLIACERSYDIEGIEYLINHGAEINRTDILGNNALMFIIKNETMPTETKLKALPILIDKGVDINWINGNFETPLSMAIASIEITIADLLIDNGGVIFISPQIAIS